MSDETADDVKDKMAKRFESEENAEKDEREKTEKSDETEKSSKLAKTSKTTKNNEPEENGESGSEVTIKDAWTNHSVYLDDELADTLSSQYKKLDWQLDDEYDLSIQKTRHYYPLVVALGLERVAELDSKEIKERIDDLANCRR